MAVKPFSSVTLLSALCASVMFIANVIAAEKNIKASALSVAEIPSIIERSGTGTDSASWTSKKFPIEPNSTYMLSFEMQTTSGSGLAVTGVDSVNIDLQGIADWNLYNYVFRTSSSSYERLHFGQWHMKGKVSYKNVKLTKVRPVHLKNQGMELGAGESVEGSTYRYTSLLSGFARNDSRTLVRTQRARFNTSRWCIGNGSIVEYQHSLAGRKILSATVRVGCCHWNSGKALIEASNDGKAWKTIGAVTNVSEYVFEVSKELFPLKTLNIRAKGTKGTNLQIHSYAVDAPIEGDVLWFTGNTRYVDAVTGKDVGGSERSAYLDEDYGEMLADNGSVLLWRASAGRKIHPNRKPPKAKASAIEIKTAANEAEAMQLVVTPKKDMSNVRVSVLGDLVDDKGLRIPAKNIDVLRVHYVLVEQVSDIAGIRGLWPDPLPPQDNIPFAVYSKNNQPFWVRVKPPKGTKKGVYRGKLLVSCTEKDARKTQSVEVPLSVEVFGFELPNKMTCETAFGAGMRHAWRYHAARTAKEKEIIANRYLDALASCHLSPYDPAPCVRWKVKWNNGIPIFDWSKWDAAVEKAVSERYINSMRFRIDGLGGGTFHSRWNPSINGVSCTNEQYQVLMERYLKGVESHLCEKGWLDMAYIYWFDEPDPKDYDFVMNGFNTLKRYAPGLRRMLTEQIEPALIGGPNIWCPHNSNLDFKMAEKRRAAGETIWWYVCCNPKAPYTGIFIDHPSNELRTWLWQTWGYGVTGILIWESLHWTSDVAYPDSPQNPYLDSMSWVSGYGMKKGTKRGWGNGDGRLFYPPIGLADGKAKTFTDGIPVGSFRSEGLRDGLEDYEYFAILKRLDSENLLLKVPQSIYSSMTKFSADPTPLEQHRVKLAREIERLLGK